MNGDNELLVRFLVPGKPVPGGSKRAFVNQYTGKPSLVDAGVGNKNWRATIADIAERALAGPLLDGPLGVRFYFVMPRPKKHYHTSKKRLGELRDDAPLWHIGPPDVLKLARAIEDSLQNVIYRNDCLIAKESMSKTYGEKPGVLVEIYRLDP